MHCTVLWSLLVSGVFNFSLNCQLFDNPTQGNGVELFIDMCTFSSAVVDPPCTVSLFFYPDLRYVYLYVYIMLMTLQSLIVEQENAGHKSIPRRQGPQP